MTDLNKDGQMSTALSYSRDADKDTFDLEEFIDLFGKNQV